MNLKDIIQAEKTHVKVGPWSTGKMPRTAFPLSKSGNKAYRLGNREWKTASFKALDADCIVLVNFSNPLRQYQAYLGVVVAGDTKLLAQLELHPGHSGWHAHLACDQLQSVPSGIKRGPWLRRLHRGRTYVENRPFDFCQADAWSVARKFFRLDKLPTGEDVFL